MSTPQNNTLRTQQRCLVLERILQVMLFFDLFFLLTSLVMLFLGSMVENLPVNRQDLLRAALLFGSYGSISALCNCFG